MLIGHRCAAGASGNLLQACGRIGGAWQGTARPLDARQWLRQAVAVTFFLLILAWGLACYRESPQAAFARIYRIFLQGDLVRAQDEAHRESQHFLNSSPEWSGKFQTLEAEVMLWRGLYEDALKLLKSRPIPFGRPDLAIHSLTLIAEADGFLRRFSEADENIEEAERLCGTSSYAGCGEVVGVHGLLADLQGDSSSAKKLYAASLALAKVRGDRFLESKTLRNLGAMSLGEERLDEAIDRSQASYEAATAVDAKVVELVAKANIGWADYKLGNREKAMETFQEAEKRASELGNVFVQENELTNIGYVYMDERKLNLAARSFQQALALAESIKAKEDIYNSLRVLARLSLQTGDLEEASQYADRALAIARESGIHKDELYPMLVQGQIAARRGNSAEAEKIFQQVERDRVCPVFLKWEAQHSLARLYEDQNRPDQAERQYRAALATFEAARADVRHEDSQLSFLTNAARIYDDYVHFLVARGKTGEALRWADYSRARTLTEGLGLLAKGTSTAPSALNAQAIARQAKGALLFYWLGEKQSYLWAITPQKTGLFILPPGAEIEAAVERYRKALGGPGDVLESANQDGQWLYRTLIAPSQALLAAGTSGAKALAHGRSYGTAEVMPSRNSSPTKYSSTRSSSLEHCPKVFVIPDGGLNNLNFETLIVSEPTPHYWIEDATVADASSLRVLAASYSSEKKRARRLLLVGDSVAPSPEYPELPKAAVQMASVARHFPAGEQRILSRGQATPAAYLASNPEQFPYIHFVAHGTASRLSPLDSAIVLSRGGAENDSFKLYARDIIRHPLRADLVTISACYGAGERTYSGEGLVGLSWAFLRAGAHNVIAALWEATDVSTEQLMSKFYDELDKGASPDAALRTAKLSLLHGGAFHNPFYWAPFQFYAGS
jgi:tetratricopeptide (TPR) repeat protein